MENWILLCLYFHSEKLGRSRREKKINSVHEAGTNFVFEVAENSFTSMRTNEIFLLCKHKSNLRIIFLSGALFMNYSWKIFWFLLYMSLTGSDLRLFAKNYTYRVMHNATHNRKLQFGVWCYASLHETGRWSIILSSIFTRKYVRIE